MMGIWFAGPDFKERHEYRPPKPFAFSHGVERLRGAEPQPAHDILVWITAASSVRR